MIVGICVGSGIFFKVDNILRFTGGNVFLGALVFIIGAFSIIFGSVSLSSLAMRTEKNGGMVAYFEDFYSNGIASAFGWFQTFLYYPTIAVVVSWAAGIYTCLLFNLPNDLNIQMGIGFVYLVSFYLINILSSKIGGHFQIISSMIKLIPLLGIGLLAIFWKAPQPTIPSDITLQPVTNVGWGWLAALAPTAFSYDGWAIALSISDEVEDSKKNMPLALIMGPIIVLVVYLAYFLGMNKILGPEYIMSVGDGSIMTVGQMLLGNSGRIIILLFILIAMLGVVNGVVLGHIRMPYALATKEMMPFSGNIETLQDRRKYFTSSSLISFAVSLFWFVMHYLTQYFGWMKTGDISEIAIVFGYVFYMVLYIKVLQLYFKKEIKHTFVGLVAPIFAIIGGLIIVIGGFSSDPSSMAVFFLICGLFCLGGYTFYTSTHKKTR